MTPQEPGRDAADEPLILQDVTSHTLGILANDADFIPILPKDSRIPGNQTRDNFINGGRSTSVDVLIFQGEDPVAFENDLIGKLPIQLPEARERGYYRFEVTFTIDQNGLLGAAVKCLNDNQVWQTELQCDVRASRQAIERGAAHIGAVMAGLPKPPE
jgi:molecular chaperone DnaK